ncbi:DUF2341 domain-containing protein, partial [bacterium]|nr:DUF2341 domain-containing protein [bacterium]
MTKYKMPNTKYFIIGALIVLIPIVYLTLKTPTKVAADWWDDSWEYRKHITIDNTKVSGASNHSYFPVLISTIDSDLAKNAQSDGDDILFTDAAGNKLDHEIERYTSSTGELIAWVEVPTLYYNEDTILYMYYGNPSTASQENATGTWDDGGSNYNKGVWHFEETSSNYDDSTSNTNHGTTVTVTSRTADGKVGYAPQFVTGSSNQIVVPHHTSLNISDSEDFTMSGWIKSPSIGADEAGLFVKGYHTETPDNANGYYVMDIKDRFYVYTLSPGDTRNDFVTGTGYEDNAWHYIVYYRDADGNTGIYIDGSGTHTSEATTSDGPISTTQDLYFGRQYDDYFTGNCDEFRIARGIVRSSDWIDTNYANQNSPSTFFSVEEEEKGHGPVAYWSFDEGYGTTTNDSTANYNGTLGTGSSAPSWQTEDLCVSGKCLYFEGTEDYIDVGTGPTSVKTVSFWTRSNTTTEYFVDLNGSAYISSSSGAVSATGFTSPTIYVDGKVLSTITANEWHYITVTTGTALSTTDLDIGRIEGTGFMQGFLDEVKIYSYVRSAAQVKADYVKGASERGSSAVLGKKSDAWLSDGLVGYWKMDETSGNAADSSGNGTILTNTDTVAYTGAKFGNGGELNGTSEYFDAVDNSALSVTGNLTLSAWIEPDDVTSHSDHIVGKFDDSDESYQLIKVDDEIRMYIDSSSNYETTDAANLSVDTMYHVASVYDSSTATVILYVDGKLKASTTTGTIPSSIGDDAGEFSIGVEDTGGTPANYYDGHIDEVRVYNRALSADEVGKLYNWVPGPVGYWPMDENTGTTSTYDSSGNGNTGTMNGSMTESDWVPGKFGSALDFDGSDDYVDTNYSADLTFFTVSFWFKTTADVNAVMPFGSIKEAGANDPIIGTEYRSTPEDFRTIIRDDAGTQLQFSTGTDINDGSWYHYALTLESGGVATVYTNGVLDATLTDASMGAISLSGEDFFIGALNSKGSDGNHMDVDIDDFRIYNYARTQEQIVQDMNAGHPAPGSPVGSPVLHLEFDEGYGDTANDSSPQGNNGDLAGSCPGDSTCPSWHNNGKYGKAIDLDGDNDYIDLGSDSSLNPTNFTYSFWVS